MASMRRMKEDEILTALPVMLTGDALLYFLFTSVSLCKL